MSEMPDPSEIIRGELRQLLGEKRAAPIEARASELAAEFAGRRGSWLRAAVAVLDDPLDSLRKDASRVRVLERRRGFAERELAQAQFEATREQMESGDPTAPSRAEKGIVQAEAGKEGALERHLAQWAEANGERTARVLALHDAFERDPGRDRRDRWEAASGRIEDPLLPYVDALGPELAGEIRGRSEQIEAAVAGLDREARMEIRQWLDRGYEGKRPHELIEQQGPGEARRLRQRREKLEERQEVLDAKVTQLDATGYRPAVARTLHLELERKEADLQSVKESQKQAWDAQQPAANAWLEKHGTAAVLSVAVERSIAAEVAEQIERRESEAALDQAPKLVRDYVPEAQELDGGGYGLE